jgi:hypothetical protein
MLSVHNFLSVTKYLVAMFHYNLSGHTPQAFLNIRGRTNRPPHKYTESEVRGYRSGAQPFGYDAELLGSQIRTLRCVETSEGGYPLTQRHKR